MSNIDTDCMVGQIVAVLKEAFDGPPEGFCYFTDPGDDAGLTALLGQVDANQASQVVGETSIAAHVYHLIFAMNVSAAWILGERSSVNWDDSWKTSDVDDASWEKLRSDLHEAHDKLRVAIENHAKDSMMAAGGAVAAATHTGYHLGIIRQKLTVLRKNA